MLGLVLRAGLAAGSGSQPTPPPPAGTLEVLDGDTVRLADGRRVRLAGLDTPELGRPGAGAATRFTRAFLAAGPARLVPADPPRDHYGRLLADLEVDGASLTAALLAAGHGWVYREDAPELVAAQADAVAARRGVHARIDALAGRLFVVTATSFHAGDCPSVRARAAQRPVCVEAASLLARGLAPCRLCLVWPP